MNGRLLDSENNDIYMDPVTKRVVRATSLKERVMRAIGTLLRTFEGESFVDYNLGVPWFDDVLGKSVLFIDEINGELKDKIMEIDGVESVVAIQVEVDGRNVSGKYKVILSDGTAAEGKV